MFLIWHMFSVLALLLRSDRARFAARSFSRLPFFTRWFAALGSAHPRGDLWLMKSTPSLAYFEESEEKGRTSGWARKSKRNKGACKQASEHLPRGGF